MNQQAPGNGSEELAQLGEPKLVCRTSRKTLFWVCVLASLFSVFGIAILFYVVQMLLTDWSHDLFGSAFYLALGLASLWGGWVLWRKVHRLRRVQAVVHVGGLSYRDGNSGLTTCRWDQVENIRWKAADHHEELSLSVGGLVPIPGATVRSHSHTTHQITVRRKDGVQLVFTDELQNIVELGRAIHQAASRKRG